jgi:hypothetical protein
MSIFKKIRSSLDAKLDKWEAQAAALEAQLGNTKEKSLDLLEQNKQALATQIDDLAAKLDAAESLSSEKRQKIRGDIDHLRVQLALGKANTRDAFKAQMRQIDLAVARLDTSLDRELDEFASQLSEEARELVRATDQLSAEMDATLLQFVLDEEVRRDLSVKKDEIVARAQAFKQNVQQNRRSVADKMTENLADVEKELNEKAKELIDFLRYER